MTSITRKTYWSGNLSAELEILHVGGDVYQFDKTVGGEWKFKRGTLVQCINFAETSERLLCEAGFERPLGYNGGSVAIAV